MANHKSAIKRHRQSEKRRLQNRQAKSALHTQLKKAHAEIGAKSAKPQEGAVGLAVKALASAATKGLMHKKTASRRISRLMKKANTCQIS